MICFFSGIYYLCTLFYTVCTDRPFFDGKEQKTFGGFGDSDGNHLGIAAHHPDPFDRKGFL